MLRLDSSEVPKPLSAKWRPTVSVVALFISVAVMPLAGQAQDNMSCVGESFSACAKDDGIRDLDMIREPTVSTDSQEDTGPISRLETGPPSFQWGCQALSNSTAIQCWPGLGETRTTVKDLLDDANAVNSAALINGTTPLTIEVWAGSGGKSGYPGSKRSKGGYARLDSTLHTVLPGRDVLDWDIVFGIGLDGRDAQTDGTSPPACGAGGGAATFVMLDDPATDDYGYLLVAGGGGGASIQWPLGGDGGIVGPNTHHKLPGQSLSLDAFVSPVVPLAKQDSLYFYRSSGGALETVDPTIVTDEVLSKLKSNGINIRADQVHYSPGQNGGGRGYGAGGSTLGPMFGGSRFNSGGTGITGEGGWIYKNTGSDTWEAVSNARYAFGSLNPPEGDADGGDQSATLQPPSAQDVCGGGSGGGGFGGGSSGGSYETAEGGGGGGGSFALASNVAGPDWVVPRPDENLVPQMGDIFITFFPE